MMCSLFLIDGYGHVDLLRIVIGQQRDVCSPVCSLKEGAQLFLALLTGSLHVDDGYLGPMF